MVGTPRSVSAASVVAPPVPEVVAAPAPLKAKWPTWQLVVLGVGGLLLVVLVVRFMTRSRKSAVVPMPVVEEPVPAPAVEENPQAQAKSVIDRLRNSMLETYAAAQVPPARAKPLVDAKLEDLRRELVAMQQPPQPAASAPSAPKAKPAALPYEYAGEEQQAPPPRRPSSKHRSKRSAGEEDPNFVRL
jgi:hypothetical protein